MRSEHLVDPLEPNPVPLRRFRRARPRCPCPPTSHVGISAPSLGRAEPREVMATRAASRRRLGPPIDNPPSSSRPADFVPNSAGLDPSSALTQPSSVDVGPELLEVGQRLPKVGRHRLNIRQVRPIPGHADPGPGLANVGRRRPKLGRIRCNFARARSKFGRHRSNLSSARCLPTSARIRPNSEDFERIWTELGQHPPAFRKCARPSFRNEY